MVYTEGLRKAITIQDRLSYVVTHGVERQINLSK